MLVPKVWYFCSAASAVFLLPYFYLYFRSEGLTDHQLGYISFLRPWVSAVANVAVPVIADKFRCHKLLVITFYIASVAMRTSVYYAASSFSLLLASILLSDFLASPVGTLVDSAVTSMSLTEGFYGRQRMWASIGWGGLSFAGGELLDGFGFGAAFLTYFVLSVPCVLALRKMNFGGAQLTAAAADPNLHAVSVQSHQLVHCGAAGYNSTPPRSSHSGAAIATSSGGWSPRSNSRSFWATLVTTPARVQYAWTGTKRALSHARQPDGYALAWGDGHAADGGAAATAALGQALKDAAALRVTPAVDGRAEAARLLAAEGLPPRYSDCMNAPPALPYTPSLGTSCRTSNTPCPPDMATMQSEDFGSPLQPLPISGTTMDALDSERKPLLAHSAAHCEKDSAAVGADDHGPAAAAAVAKPTSRMLFLSAFASSSAWAAVSDGGSAASDGAPSGEKKAKDAAGAKPPFATLLADAPAARLPASLRLRRTTSSQAQPGSGPAAPSRHDLWLQGSASPRAGSSANQLSAASCKHGPLHAKAVAASGGGSAADSPAAALQPFADASYWCKAGVLLTRAEVWLFLLKCAVIGFGLGAIGTFLFVYIAELGGSHALQGLMLLFNCLAEVLAFHFQDRIRRALAPNAVLHLAIGTLVLRMLLYVALPGLPGCPWLVLPIELLHGVTFGMSWGVCTVHCKRVAPDGLQAAMQGLMQATYFGISSALGGLASAFLHQRLGGRGMFGACALLVAGCSPPRLT